MPSYQREHDNEGRASRRRLPLDVAYGLWLWVSVRVIVFLTLMALMWGVGVRLIVEVFKFGWTLIPW